jgi:U3 small nucleolar RNA-associated protein 22
MPERATKRRKVSSASAAIDSEDSDFEGFSDQQSVDNIDGDSNLHVDFERQVSAVNLAASRASNPDKNGSRNPNNSKSNATDRLHKTAGSDSVASAFTGEVYKSNLFKLQLDELLLQVKPKLSKNASTIEALLRELKQVIEDIPLREPVTVRISFV